MDDAKARTRRQILEVAAWGILEVEGARAVSTRSVAAAAGIGAASLYQLFGDKDGLLAALAIHAFDIYLAEKHNLAHTDDPVHDMRRGWDIHVDFGLRHPAFYLLMYGTDRPGRRAPAAAEANDLLLKFLDRAAAAGLPGPVRPRRPPLPGRRHRRHPVADRHTRRGPRPRDLRENARHPHRLPHYRPAPGHGPRPRLPGARPRCRPHRRTGPPSRSARPKPPSFATGPPPAC